MADYVFECDNGHVYGCKPPFCAICQHCTDYFWDYSNGPYLFLCELSKDNSNHDCHDFLLDEGAVTVEEYIVEKQKKCMEEQSKFDLTEEFIEKVKNTLEDILKKNENEREEIY